MDAEEQFRVTVKETVAALLRKGKDTREWTSDDGTVISGWSVESWSHGAEVKGDPGRGWWRETWGNGCRILSKEGEFWEYSFGSTDEMNKSTVLSYYLRRTPDSYLVGTKGKPFSEMTEFLERMPYL